MQGIITELAMEKTTEPPTLEEVTEEIRLQLKRWEEIQILMAMLTPDVMESLISEIYDSPGSKQTE